MYRDKEVKRVYDKTWEAKRKKRYAEDPHFRYTIYLRAVKRKFGLTRDEYEYLYREGCWLCGQPFVGTTRPHVDHNHVTHEVRGLAHPNCNVIIGMAKEVPELLRRIATSLEQYGTPTVPE